MSKSKSTSRITIVIGVLILVTGVVRMRTASGLRDGADELLRQQREAQAARYRAATETNERVQSGELDDAGWRREMEAVSTRFNAYSEPAGAALGGQLALANRTKQQGFTLLLIGLLCTSGGMIFASKSKRIAQPSVPGGA